MDRGQYEGLAMRNLPRGKVDAQTLGLLSMAMPSPLGDITGLLSDGMGYAQNPSSLTPTAGLLSLAGLVPGVPSVKFGPKQREALEYWVREAGSLKEARRQLWDTVKKTKDPEMEGVARYADEIDGILSFHRAEDPDPVSLAKWLRKNPVGADGKMAAKVLDIEGNVVR